MNEPTMNVYWIFDYLIIKIKLNFIDNELYNEIYCAAHSTTVDVS